MHSHHKLTSLPQESSPTASSLPAALCQCLLLPHRRQLVRHTHGSVGALCQPALAGAWSSSDARHAIAGNAKVVAASWRPRLCTALERSALLILVCHEFLAGLVALRPTASAGFN